MGNLEGSVDNLILGFLAAPQSCGGILESLIKIAIIKDPLNKTLFTPI